MIKVNNITKLYHSSKGDEVVALNHLSINIKSRGLTFICGKSGAGKTTFLNLIGGLDKCSSGDIEVFGHVITKFSEQEITNYRNFVVGIVFQEFHLLEDCTVEENIYHAIHILPEQHNHYSVDEVLELVGILDLKHRFINELSGGQKQRVSIARALVKKPKILLCDEPTGSLDFETGKQIIKLLKEISNKISVIIVSHQIEDANQFGDRVITFDNGLIKNDKIKNDYNNDKKINSELQLKKVKKKLKYKDLFKISCRFLKVKWSRLFIIIPLFLICLLLFNIILSINFSNNDRVIKKAMMDNHLDYVSIDKKYILNDGKDKTLSGYNMNENDYQYLKDNLNADIDIVYDEFNCMYSNLGNGGSQLFENIISKINYYSKQNRGAIEINQKFLDRYGYTLDGRLPKYDDEIVITEYIFELYQLTNYKDGSNEIKIREHEDLIGKTITFSSSKPFKIVGIIDTKMNSKRYKPLSNQLINLPTTHILRYELEDLLQHGIHNLIYMNEGYFDKTVIENQTDIPFYYEYKDYTSGNHHSYKSFRKNTDPTGVRFYRMKDLDETEYEIYIPIDFDVNSKQIEEKISGAILEYAESTYFQIRDQWIDDGNRDDYYYYYYYICTNEINKYSPNCSYKNFQEAEIDLEIKNRIKNPTVYLPTFGFDKNANTDVNINIVGFFDAQSDEEINYCYFSEELYDLILNDYQYLLYNYRNFIIPLKDFEAKNFEMRNEEITDSNLLLENKLLINYNSDEHIYRGNVNNGVKYDICNEIITSFDYLKDYIEIILLVLKLILPCLAIILILVMYHYFSHVILEKKKDIGIFRLLGYQKREIFIVFLNEIIVILLPVLIVNMLLCSISVNFINHYFDKIYFALYPIANLGFFAILVTIIVTFILGLIGISLPLYRILRKTPVQIISNK
ncbi:aBC-type transport system ATPase component putative [Staphylococcus sp. CAG:324]|nr:aBC-type transport system ATPase component putative [Staphylococcus sp. CAG:324]